MKIIVVLTAMLWYEGSIITEDTYTKDFLTHEQCQSFAWLNKVELVDGLLAKHRFYDDKVFGIVELQSFDFFCETKYIIEDEEIEPEEEPKLILEL
tara:strand:- start:37 stop:324 length:288 start_codon:yes stop_codon:yes gene_type:complete